ncbi:MAG: hypothetical protein ACR2NR_15365 [Solirubrobacteraceae bacterium]
MPAPSGRVYGMANGVWAAAIVVAPLVLGVVAQHAGAGLGYLAVTTPALAIGCGSYWCRAELPWTATGSRSTIPKTVCFMTFLGENDR